jgi:hypothetical protein
LEFDRIRLVTGRVPAAVPQVERVLEVFVLRVVQIHQEATDQDQVRQALDALDNLRRGGDAGNGNGQPANDAEIETIVEVADDLASQSAVERVPAVR